MQRVRWSGTQAIAALTEGNSRREKIAELERFCGYFPADTVHNRRKIAENLL
jgi:hypothetical protein